MKIYIDNLSYGVTDDVLGDIFSEYGDVTSVNIIEDRGTGRSEGFAFVEMPNQAEAEEAMKNIAGAVPVAGKICGEFFPNSSFFFPVLMVEKITRENNDPREGSKMFSVDFSGADSRYWDCGGEKEIRTESAIFGSVTVGVTTTGRFQLGQAGPGALYFDEAGWSAIQLDDFLAFGPIESIQDFWELVTAALAAQALLEKE